jgi:hypothetical protein
MISAKLVPWKALFKTLTRFLLCKEIFIEASSNKEITVIKSKGCILGQVSSVKCDSVRYDRQHVEIIFNNISRSLGNKREWGAQWTLQASAKSIRQGDLVCLLQGVSKPIIIRMCRDHFAVIMIVVTLRQGVQTEKGYLERQEPFQWKAFREAFYLSGTGESPRRFCKNERDTKPR